MKRCLRVSVIALAATALLPARAVADSAVGADPTAAKRQRVRRRRRVVATRRGRDLPARGASRWPDRRRAGRAVTASFDPDVASDETGAIVIVYSRCQDARGDGRCDIYRLDAGTLTESRFAGVNRPESSEIAPSYFKGMLAWARTGARAGRGIYLLRPGRGIVRLASDHATETDLWASRLLYVARDRRTSLRLLSLSGTRRRTITASNVGSPGRAAVLSSPQLSQYYAYWLRRTPGTGKTVVQRAGVSSNPNRDPRVASSKRVFGSVSSLAVDRAPVLFTLDGVWAFDRDAWTGASPLGDPWVSPTR